MNKNLLRQQAMKMRNSLNSLEVQGKSHEISQLFLSLPLYREVPSILSYLSFGSEIDTTAIIKNAWLRGKRVLVPVCQTKDKTLLISELRSLNELSPGTWGIPEPKKEYLRPVSPSEIGLAIIPGLAFDSRGHRLGFGAGYYDRFLSTLPSECPKIALAYNFQIVEFIPNEAHDVPVDLIVTEKRILQTTR